MKTLSLFFLALFSFTLATQAAPKVKRYAVTKIIKAIEKDADKALKDYADDFECKFGIEDFEYIPVNSHKRAKVKGKDQEVSYGDGSGINFDNDLKEGKKILYLCKLEKYTNDDGKEAVRIVVLQEISR